MKNLVRICLALGATAFAAACSPSNPPADSGVTTDTGVGGDSSTPTDSGVPSDSSAPADSGVPSDGGGTVDRATACTAYCTAVTRACTGANMQYMDMAACNTACNAATYEVGMAGATSGNSISCRTYHAGAAMTDPATHCPHAGPTGGGVCQ